MENRKPAVGDVWENMNPESKGVRFRIDMLTVDGHYAFVERLDRKRRTQINLKRLKPGSRGYKLISYEENGSTVYVGEHSEPKNDD